jgi:hypothetical protein
MIAGILFILAMAKVTSENLQIRLTRTYPTEWRTKESREQRPGSRAERMSPARQRPPNERTDGAGKATQVAVSVSATTRTSWSQPAILRAEN